jgi:uncharacterized protein
MTLWISLKDLPEEGQEFNFIDQSLWAGPMKDFGVAGTIRTPLEASLYIVPQDEGFLVSGSMHGTVALPCDFCLEEFEVPVQADFDSFEEAGQAEDQYADEVRVRLVKGLPEFDAGGYLWEQFMLALPTRPVCKPDCKGLCPRCGKDRNKGDCGCGRDDGDPRLAVLRKLKVS